MSQPRVSIGLPVYNGAGFLVAAIESILAQDHGDFELIISNNASTDGSEDICLEYAQRDKRIRYYRVSENMGAAWNFNRTVHLAEFEFFKWAAHDDLLEPGFLGACVRALAADSGMVLAYTKAIEIDKDGCVLRPYRIRLHLASSDQVQLRFRVLTGNEHNCYPIFGVIRTSILKQTPLIGAYVGSDRVLLAELALRGRFQEISEPLFLHREHSGRSTRSLPLHQRASWFDPRQTGKYHMPYWRFLKEYAMAIQRVPLTLYERACCLFELARWLKRYRHRLVSDLRWRMTEARCRSMRGL